MTNLRPSLHKLGLGAALLAAACGSPTASGRAGAEPQGPVAHDAGEAFPDRPAGVPAMKPGDIAAACAESAACIPDRATYSAADLSALIDLCVSDVRWSAERAIPLSSFSHNVERPEFYVACVLSHTGDCNAVNACRTDRDPAITCQEDGCTAPTTTQVSCAGDVATITINGVTTERDCTRAFAACDASSPTGCTDRHYTACPPGVDTADRCDGDVRLGCDGAGQVSYHDCARLGGTCGDTGNGNMDCIYPGAEDPDCTADQPKPAACTGSDIAVCMGGQRVTAAAPDFCGG